MIVEPCNCDVIIDYHTGCVEHGHCLHPTCCIAYENCPVNANWKGYSECTCGIEFRPRENRHQSCIGKDKCVHATDCPNFEYRDCPSYYQTKSYQLDLIINKRRLAERLSKRPERFLKNIYP